MDKDEASRLDITCQIKTCGRPAWTNKVGNLDVLQTLTDIIVQWQCCCGYYNVGVYPKTAPPISVPKTPASAQQTGAENKALAATTPNDESERKEDLKFLKSCGIMENPGSD